MAYIELKGRSREVGHGIEQLKHRDLQLKAMGAYAVRFAIACKEGIEMWDCLHVTVRLCIVSTSFSVLV